MLRTLFITTALTGALLAGAAHAQGVEREVQRDANQQQRIEQGLKSGQLTTNDAARLERGEARIDRMESNALRDGALSQQEKDRIRRAQNAESQKIERLKSNARTGNPDSASTRRLQADVQRNVNQERRIEQGVASGSLTNREVGRLEKKQSRIAGAEAKAAADGHVGAAEQRRVEKAENRASRQIYRTKHNDQTKN